MLKSVKTALVSLMQTLLSMVAGLCVYVAAAALIGDRGFWNMGAAILLTPLFGFAAVFIHEMGHATAAWRCNWIVEQIVVWPVSYSLRRRHWSRAPGIARFGDMFGWVACHPKGDAGSRMQETLVLAGGVIANLLAALLCLVLSTWVGVSPLDTVLAAFGTLSIIMAIGNILPWKIAGASSDGLRLWRLWHRAKQRKTARSKWNVPRKG